MSDMSDSIENRLSALEKRLDRRSRLTEILQYAEKLFVPLTVALLALVANAAANKISEGQLALARAQEQRQQRESLAQTQLKYMELVYPDLRSDDSKRQLWALGLLLRIDPESGKALANAVADNPSTSEDVRQQARKIIRQIIRYGPLSQYVINFILPSGASDRPLPATVRTYEYLLKRDGFEGRVNHEENSSLELLSLRLQVESRPGKHFILYDSAFEEDAAQRLKLLLESLNERYKFELYEVGWSSPGVISVLLAEDVLDS